MKPNRKMTDDRIAMVVGALTTSPAVRGVICFGSRAMGRDDERSDVDLYVFGRKTVPRKSVRIRCYRLLPGITNLRIDRPGHDRQWWPQVDEFHIGGLTFDIAYRPIDGLATIIRKLKGGSLSLPELRFRPFTLPGLLANSVVLYDPEGLLAGLVASIYPYPSRLRQALISKSLSSLEELLADLRDAARRGVGQTAFLFHLAFMNGNLSTLLHTINRRYDPATKRVEQDLAALQALPRDFLARYKAVLTGPFDRRGQLRAADEYERFINEARMLARRKT